MSGVETVEERKARERRERIEQSRRELAERYAANPEGVSAFNLRMSRIAQARKREEERVERAIHGPARPADPDLVRPSAMSRQDWKIERKRRLAQHQRAVRQWERDRKSAEGNAPTAEQQAHVAYVETDITDYRGGRLVKLDRTYRRQVRFETIDGLTREQLAALRVYRRAFDETEMSEVKCGLDIGPGGGAGGSDAALRRVEMMAFAGIGLERIESRVAAHLRPVLRAVALHDSDFKAVALARYGSASGQRRTRVRDEFFRAVDMLITPTLPLAMVTAVPLIDESDGYPVPSAYIDERGFMRTFEEIADIIRGSWAGDAEEAAE